MKSGSTPKSIKMQCIGEPASSLLVTHSQTKLQRSIDKKVSNLDCEPVQYENHPTNCAVYIRNLCKRYKNGPPILQNMCINVGKGTIYGLLGASGCGKTTVFSCIVGLTKWDSGEIQVFGHAPGTKESGIPGTRLGYMPQDVALYNQLTVEENMEFYTRIYNIPKSKTRANFIFLKELLELPEESRRISDLSGGQQRRVSLALALIHSPELLILDEPTVGLDPLVRARIWDYLYKIANSVGTTIIVSTHYLEEARQAHTIGVIRRGRLLVEDKPLVLLQNYQCQLLEQVVLLLCKKDEINTKALDAAQRQDKVVFKSSFNIKASSCAADIEQGQQGVYRNTDELDCRKLESQLRQTDNCNKRRTGNCFANLRKVELYESFQKVYGLSKVIWRFLTRYPLFLAIMVILPTFAATITLLVVGSRPHGMKLGIVNNELLNWTTVCNFENSSFSSCNLTFLSCKYLKELRKNGVLTLTPYDTENGALQNVHNGNILGYMVFASNYTQHALDFGTARFFSSNDSIEGSRLHVYLDQSDYALTVMMSKHLFESYVRQFQQLADPCDFHVSDFDIPPLNFRSPVYGTNEEEFATYCMPGAVLAMILCVLSTTTAIIFIADRNGKTLSRAQVAGVKSFHVLASHFITAGVMVSMQTIFLGMVLKFCFDFPIVGSLWLCALFCLLEGLCGAAIGVLLGMTCNDEVEAVIIEIAILPFILVFGGLIWPTESMSAACKLLGSILPNTVSTISLRTVAIRGLGLLHPVVWPGLAVPIIWIVVIFILSLISFRGFC